MTDIQFKSTWKVFTKDLKKLSKDIRKLEKELSKNKQKDVPFKIAKIVFEARVLSKMYQMIKTHIYWNERKFTNWASTTEELDKLFLKLDALILAYNQRREEVKLGNR